MDNFDWTVIEEWVVTESGNMTYREIAAASDTLVSFGYQSCSHEKIREKGKENLWFSKRAEHQAEQHGGIMDDYRQAYEIVTKTLIERFSDLSATEMASLGNLQLKYGDALMALNPPSKDSKDVPIFTRDDIMAMAEEVEVEMATSAIDGPLDMLNEETPGLDAASGSDEGDNAVS